MHRRNLPTLSNQVFYIKTAAKLVFLLPISLIIIIICSGRITNEMVLKEKYKNDPNTILKINHIMTKESPYRKGELEIHYTFSDIPKTDQNNSLTKWKIDYPDILVPVTQYLLVNKLYACYSKEKGENPKVYTGKRSSKKNTVISTRNYSEVVIRELCKCSTPLPT